jgi:outer membrane protein
MKKVLLIAFISLLAGTSYAQTTKVGTVDRYYILTKMPELVGMENALKDYNKELQNDLKEKLDNYDKVYKTAEANFDMMTNAQKEAKQKELTDLENDISKFRQNGAQLIQLKENELITPLYSKINDYVALVAKELSFTQIFFTGDSNLVYLDPAFDITSKVLDKMGLEK